MAPASAAATDAPMPRPRPRVGLLYTHASPLSGEGENLAKYIGLALVSTGAASQIAVVGVDVNASKPRAEAKEPQQETAIIRADGVVFKQSQVSSSVVYEETCDVRKLSECHVWIICLDAGSAENALQFVQKRVVNGDKNDTNIPKRRVVMSLQPAHRQLRELESTFPKDTVLIGGACFHLTKNKHGILYPLSHGCYFIERLSSEKADAIYALDLLEATGFQLLSRKNIQALKWGHSMLRLFYYVNALTGETVANSLRDRAMRLVYLEMLHEMDSLFTAVTADLNDDASANPKEAAARRSWAPDASACTYLSIHAIMVLLPLPNWLFNAVTKLVDLGLTASSSGFSTIASDVARQRETEFWTEFRDVFELAKRRSVELPALTTLKTTLTALTQQPLIDDRPPTISGRGLLSQIQSTAAARAVSRQFWIKIIVTVLATLLLLLYVLS